MALKSHKESGIKMKIVELTPGGPDFPWYLQAVEAVIQVVVFPFAVACNFIYKIFDKITDRYVS